MQINRNNYEEYFLLYTDNELDARERTAVEAFAAGNPDLQEELTQLQQYRMVPEKIVFPGKENLLKHAGNGFIHTANYETCFLLYTDNELTEQQRTWVEEFVQDHPELQEEFTLISKVVLSPDNALVFPEKERLYRYEYDKVIPFTWRKIAAAAVIILTAGALLWQGYYHTAAFQSQIAQRQEDPAHRLVPASASPDPSFNHQPVSVNPDNSLLKQGAPAMAIIQPQEDGATMARDEKALIDRTAKSLRRSQARMENTLQPAHASIVALNTIPSMAKSPNPIIDKPAVLVDPTEAADREHDQAGNMSFASNTNTEDVYITNISVDKKIPLRGFFRKASRLINKATGLNTDEKGILIGNLAIAVK